MAEDRIIPVNIEEQMKTAYIDYSMSVIVSRAIPDVRDGLKPVHRRVLYGMHELGLQSNKPHKKSARIVGEVLGKYHPHGDASVYDTMVRMAQDWSLRYPLVDGQGNFGSMDNDPPAAMRYTEARLRQIAEEMITDIEKETVDFQLNFDDSLQEPTVMPARIPNLIVNGASGIAVGMATNILPHNLGEVIDGCIAYIDNRAITIPELMQFIKAPDFPTGGTILEYDGVREAFMTGRGRVVVRGKTEIETTNDGKQRIVITEVPYQVNKAGLLARAAELVNEKRIEGISAIRDESSREGIRIVIELKRDAVPNVIINRLYQFTPLQTSYGVNNIALVNGRPKLLNLKDFIHQFIDFRHDVIVRRSKYELRKAEERAHILEGYLKALDHLDEVIALIRKSTDPDEAQAGLMKNFDLSEIQAKAILELRLQRLTGLERKKIRTEHDEIMKQIAWLNEVLNSESMRMQIIKDELTEIKANYADARRSDIDFSSASMSMEDIIPDEQAVITISRMGYIKRTAAAEYRTQGRGGRGARGSLTRDEDFIEHLFIASTHDYLLVFTEKGKCFWMKVWEVPEGSKTSKGRAIQNLLQLEAGDRVRGYLKVRGLEDEEFVNSHYIMLCTRRGLVKKTLLEAFSRPRANGIIAITVNEGDQLIEARLTDGNSNILVAVQSGRAVRFSENKVRPMGRNAAGVRGITPESETDEVVGMVCVEKDSSKSILVISEKGLGKRSPLEDYPIHNRGGKGVITLKVTEKTGRLVAIKAVKEHDELMVIKTSGVAIRMSVDDISEIGRNTQGVRVTTLETGEEIADVAQIETDEPAETGNGLDQG
jgi:DNA gyrase subunit A